MKPYEKFAIIADDFTGAGDSGIHFPRTGRQIDLLLQKEEFSEQLRHSSSVSLSTESRFMTPDEASSTVAAIIYQCQSAGITQFFKKIDSTLRGNPGREIESALEATGRPAALICTAMPRTGRTCVGGSIYLHNTPLHETELRDDPFNPISTSSVTELLAQQTSLPAGTLSLEQIEAGAETLAEHLRLLVASGIRLIVADAVTDQHLLSLARLVDMADLLPVGASGFARALAETRKLPEAATVQKTNVQPLGPILAVIGSLSGISRQQADLACHSGHFIPFDIQTHYGRADIEREFAYFQADFEQSAPNILLRISATPAPAGVSKREGERVASLLGEAAAVICERYGCRTVFSTGGSTSMGVARALGIGAVALQSEIMPGVVLGSCTAANTEIEWFISKAGGFGDKEILKKIAAGFAARNRGV